MCDIERVRQQFVEEGLQEALRRATRKYQHLMDGLQEAHLLALACGQPPKGIGVANLRLLASEMVQLEYIESVSHVTVRHIMQNNELKPGSKKERCIPPKRNRVVYRMEDVLEVYQRPEEARFR